MKKIINYRKKQFEKSWKRNGEDIMIIAYARENSLSFTVAEQKKHLDKYGYEWLYIDKEDSSDWISSLHNVLNVNDTLVICELTMSQLPSFFERLREKQIGFVSIRDNIYIDGTKESEFLNYLNLLVKTESKVKSNLTLRGLHQAKEEGRIGGRPSISQKKINQIHELGRVGKYSYRQIADICHVSLGAVHKYLKEENTTNDSSVLKSNNS